MSEQRIESIRFWWFESEDDIDDLKAWQIFDRGKADIKVLLSHIAQLEAGLRKIVSEGRELSSREYFTVNDGLAVVYLDRLEDIIEIAAALSEQEKK